jgi:hypothetical protein
MKNQAVDHLQLFKSCWVLIGLFCALNVYAQNKNSAPPAAPTAPVPACSASEFKALAYTINDAQVREERAKEWLSKYGKSCPMDQIEIILSNQAVWLGTADTPVIISGIETIYKQKKAAAQELANIVDKPRGNANNK